MAYPIHWQGVRSALRSPSRNHWCHRKQTRQVAIIIINYLFIYMPRKTICNNLEYVKISWDSILVKIVKVSE